MAEPTKNTYEATTRMTDVNGFPIHTNEAGSGPALFGFHGGGPGANALSVARPRTGQSSASSPGSCSTRPRGGTAVAFRVSCPVPARRFRSSDCR